MTTRPIETPRDGSNARAVQGLALAVALVCGVGAAGASATEPDIAEMSLEELANVRVTSVTGRPRAAGELAASLFVITGEDIRRSTARSLPEALRLAPHLQVARLNANQWAISARGFNNTIGNKLLVLIDGRTVYSPLYSGVFWDTHEVLLQDVERIEVISGPGGTVWGANAVNGVINVITRSAAGTRGTLVAVEAGEEGHQLSVRQGGRFGDGSGAWRLYGLQLGRDPTRLETGQTQNDAMRKKQIGTRADWRTPGRAITLQGDLYEGEGNAGSSTAPRLSGGNLLGRWQQTAADGSNWQLQGYVDVARRHDDVIFRDHTRTLDLQFNHAPVVATNHKLIWGFGHRTARSETRPTALVRFEPEEKSLKWSHVFVQDEWSATRNLQLTAGIKAERNVYTGTEWLPTLRVSYRISETDLVWASASRAVRAPARLDRDFFFPAAPPYIIAGGPAFRTEVANVIELGYRGQHAPGASYSATLFHHEYERLRAGTSAPTFVENRARGRVSGVEAWGSVDLQPRWRLSGSWVRLIKSLSADPEAASTSVPNLGNDPKNQWMLRSTATPIDRLEVDLTLRHASALPEPAVAARTVADLRLGWRVSRALELSLLVNNLGNRRTAEFSPAESSVFDRSAHIRLVWTPP